MAHENTVSFKVFLLCKDSDKPEVRRFGIDRDVVSNFSYLSEKLQNVFPALRGKRCDVMWKDSDGDDVLISTDDELMIALTEMPGDVHKLYVTINGNGPKEHPSKLSGASHGDVVCDVCEKSIVGFRYKCLECTNYDLCAECESKGYHPEHFMIRLPVPVSWRPHFGKRLAHHLSKSVRRSNSYCSGEETPGTTGDGECPYIRHGHGRGHPRGYHGRHAGWLDAVSALLSDLLPRHDFPNSENTTNAGEKAKEETSTSSGQTQSEASTSKSNAEATSIPDENTQYLLNVGKAVASFLDPLGIDTDFKVVRNKISADTPEAKPAEEKIKKNVSFADVQSDKIIKEESTVKKGQVALEPVTERESPEKDGWTVVHPTDASSQDSGVSVQNIQEASPKIDTASASAPAPSVELSNGASVSTSATSASTSTPSQAGAYPKTFPVYYPPNPTYTAIPGSFPPPPPPPMGAPQWPMPPSPFAAIFSPQNFPQPQPQPQLQPQPRGQQQIQSQQAQTNHHGPLHPDPKIHHAVQSMMSMGFSNDGGWLTQLVEMKNGDIDKVLDLLQPVKKN